MSADIDRGRYPSQKALRDHYEIEKELAVRLMNASRADRCRLYSSVYDELFKRVSYHPLTPWNLPVEQTAESVAGQMRFLKPFLSKDTVFLEIGAGNCALSLAAAGHVKRVYALDVSTQMSKDVTSPANMQVLLFDGCRMGIKENRINLAYSNQLIEHLHPEDAVAQVRFIYDVLTQGGRYVCITPNRLAGPHDVSKYFDKTATGFHLKEYSVGELSRLFKTAGFKKIHVYAGGRGKYVRLPVLAVKWCESLLSLLPYGVRQPLAAGPLMRWVLGIRLVGEK